MYQKDQDIEIALGKLQGTIMQLLKIAAHSKTYKEDWPTKISEEVDELQKVVRILRLKSIGVSFLLPYK